MQLPEYINGTFNTYHIPIVFGAPDPFNNLMDLMMILWPQGREHLEFP